MVFVLGKMYGIGVKLEPMYEQQQSINQTNKNRRFIFCAGAVWQSTKVGRTIHTPLLVEVWYSFLGEQHQLPTFSPQQLNFFAGEP